MRALATGAVVASVLVAPGCGNSAKKPTVPTASFGGGSATALVAVHHSLRCPSRAPQAISLDVATPRLVRPGAVLLDLCRYTGLNARQPHKLARSRLISEIGSIEELTRELNALSQRHGLFNCPNDDGSEVLLIFGYRQQKPEHVIVGLTGCHAITNGRTSRIGLSHDGGRLVKQLRTLTSR